MNLLVALRFVKLPVVVILGLVIASGDAEVCSKNSGLTCTNCTHIEFCDPWSLKTEYINCDQLTKSSKKYCNAGDCSAEPLPQCLESLALAPIAEANPNFRCTTSGLVPDPTNCRQYYNCPESNGQAELRTCPANKQYNANTFGCEEFAKCLTVDCAASDRLIVAYGPDTPFYVFCDRDETTGVRHPMVLRCPNNRIYDGILQECVVPPPPGEAKPPQVDTTHPYNFFCNSADMFPDPLNCTRFYDCPGRARAPVAYACPSPGRYNARTGNCELGLPCRVIDCAAEETYVVAYDVNSPYYLFCDYYQNKYSPSMYRCPEGMLFSRDTYLCESVTSPTTTTAAPTTTTPTPATGFTCTSIGSFPDPYNCRVYHICTSPNVASVRHHCPTTHFYSISTETCVRQIFIDQCVTINCGGNAARLQVFGPNRRYYADCSTSPMKVYKCPNGKLLNVTTGICE